MNAFKIIEEGFVHRCPETGPESVAATSRCAVTRTGEVVCHFHLQSDIGVNDFVPHIARSKDGGKTWHLQGPVWPSLRSKFSINASIRNSPDGTLFLYGFRMPITKPGESFWCQETLGILPNELIWARSEDDGYTWSDPHVFQLPLPGAAETPSPLCVTRSGRWLAPYAPHNTFDPNLKVELRHTVLMISDDEGASWRHTTMMQVKEENSCVAVSWITELSDGRLLATCTHIAHGTGPDFHNPYTLSSDGGETWLPTRATPIMGGSQGTASWDDGKVLFVYSQRRNGPPGIWLALAKPTEQDFGVICNDRVWSPEMTVKDGGTAAFTNWTNYLFGEPSVTVLPDKTVLVVLWCIQPDGRGIRFVRLKVE